MTSTSMPPLYRGGRLSSLPIEVKEMIVYWVHHLPSTQQRYYRRHRRKRFQKQGDSLPLFDIRSLASVDRTFRQICSFYLYGWLNFSRGAVPRIRFAYQEIIPRHSHCVKMIWWRGSSPEVYSHTDEVRQKTWDGSGQSSCNSTSRFELFLEILRACPQITHLDIDMAKDPSPDGDVRATQSSSVTKYDYGKMAKFIKPLSHLTSLTHLSLVPYDKGVFTEIFLVELISNLPQLQSFACSHIDRSATKKLADSECYQSSLAVHLASLPHLTRLILKNAYCVNASWSEPNWKSSLEELSLANSPLITVAVFHAFTQLFASTLVELEVNNVPCDTYWMEDPTLTLRGPSGGPLQFELPKLKTLKISTWLPVGFLWAFQASKDLSYLFLQETSFIDYEELVGLIEDELWPNLKRFQISPETGSLSLDEITELNKSCQKHGVEMNINCNINNGEEDDSEDSEDSEEEKEEGESD
ncbi:uncharacterized protein MELLADRAFT_93935 [Melampsora larici-populina 98AG31]|uniref:F-box domain-containing protein n=1 Tax=Melampsora larici-populina (strain 98AG31 / pathotype 3-4-7) TaxID=747676 RepID=F4S5T7_MELLP|nr:uncharacterized protein MELLADRAFT_93935 [Melampsora larici-populina 98AG31]EGF99955.1 hypothetical protein MELLADRAFT_93935 [Melampsora larici-populina 98AG31]